MPKTLSSRAGFHKQQTKLRRAGHLRVFHEEDVTGRFPANFRNPAPLLFGVEIGDEIGDDARDERLKGFVPTVFLRVEKAFPMHHPSHITWPMRTKHIG